MFSYLKKLSAWPHKTNYKKEKEFQSIFNRALTLSEWGMHDVSIPLYLKALSIYPTNDAAHFKLAEDYKSSNQIDKAIIHYKECLKINAEDPYGVSLKLYLLGENKNIDPMPVKYVERLFDQFAPYFDKKLLETLKYSVPSKTSALLKRHMLIFSSILDLGCGTGLSAMAYKGRVKCIHGVDISSKMLEQAAQKNIYTELHREDVHSYLEKCEEKYDLILALDLLIYIADLNSLFSLIPSRLNGRGIFAFSVQLADCEYSLGEDCRYSHSHAYLSDIIKRNHLRLIDKKEIILRTEYETPVAGAIYICSQL